MYAQFLERSGRLMLFAAVPCFVRAGPGAISAGHRPSSAVLPGPPSPYNQNYRHQDRQPHKRRRNYAVRGMRSEAMKSPARPRAFASTQQGQQSQRRSDLTIDITLNRRGGPDVEVSAPRR